VAELHILREHSLGLHAARKLAFNWAEQVEKEFGMTCTYEEGVLQDEVCFNRAGVDGTLVVTHNRFELRAKLGFLVGAFKARIESEIVKNLDELLAAKPIARKHTAVKK